MVLSSENIKKETEEGLTLTRPHSETNEASNFNNSCPTFNMENPLNRVTFEKGATVTSRLNFLLPTFHPSHSRETRDALPRSLHHHAERSESRKLTNFSIDQILRADFGPQPSGRHSDDGAVPRPFTFGMASEMMSKSSFFTSPLCCSSTRLLSAFSPFSPKSAFVSRTRDTDKYCSQTLTPPPSSPESSTSSLSPSSIRHKSETSPITRHRGTTSSPRKETSSTHDGKTTAPETSQGGGTSEDGTDKQLKWPAWVYCTRYSDRPSSGPRYRKPRQSKPTDKRPRTAFSTSQLHTLRSQFQDCPYLSESRRISLARELGLSESQVKIWFQNKRAKLKKGFGVRNPLAQLLMEEGLYNHSTIVVRGNDNDDNHSTTNNNNSHSNPCDSGAHTTSSASAV